MPLNGAIIKKAGTNSVTGGTDVTYSETGAAVVNGKQLIDSSVADFRIRPVITAKVKQPTLKAGVYSKDRKSLQLVIPKILTSGETVFNLIRIEREVHPESTAAEALELNTQGAQMLYDSDFSNFWSLGTLA
jgi:hypothetical protein